MNTKLVVITAPSGAGKTTLQDAMLDRGWKRPFNFTTRVPRTEDAYEIDEDGDFCSHELDEYTFLTKKQFFTKLRNGDLLEYTGGYGKWYGISSSIPTGNVCVIVDPIGKSQILAKKAMGKLKDVEGGDIDVDCYFLDIAKDVQLKRLQDRGDSEEEIKKRQSDFIWFKAQQGDMIIDGTWATKLLVNMIEGFSLNDKDK